MLDPYLAGDLIGFTVGLAISGLLLVLTLRAAILPGTPGPNIWLAVCALMWNSGGLAHAVAVLLGLPNDGRAALVASAIQFTGAAVWPIPILAIWRHLAVHQWQIVGFRTLQALSLLSAVAIVLPLWAVAATGTTILPFLTLKELTSYNGSILAVLGVATLLKGRLSARAFWFSSLGVLLGVVIGTLIIVIQNNFKLSGDLNRLLDVASKQFVLFIVLGAFFLFARFRFADLLIRYTLRVVLAGIAAVALVLVIYAPFASRLANITAFPRSALVFGASVLGAGLLILFAVLDRSFGSLVNRWIFRTPDYRVALRELAEQLRSLHLEADVTAAVEISARKTLELKDARLIDMGMLPPALWPSGIHDGEIVEVDRSNPLRSLLSLPEVELLIPIRVAGQVTSILAISPGPARRGLVTQEVGYLRNIAAQFGSQLDSLRLEQDMVQRQSREAMLLQQVTAAELRALRAQVNPHFLFNSLNTIANLIATNPSQAEIMTLRLAKVFHHVLTHSSRPLAPIREEIDFLRTYLEIEEARFGKRLQVQIDIAAEVALDPIPSLILQPVVENALKHGLAPKRGLGHLWISAEAQGDHVCLKVEDDGVGPRSRPSGLNNRHQQVDGVGLTNVSQRLATLYQDRAFVSLEAREAGGTSVTVTIPRGAGFDCYAESHY